VTARRELPEELRGRSFSVRDSVELNIPEHRLDAGDLVRPFHGVRSPADEEFDLAARCRALATRFRPGDAFDGATAAMLWGAPLPRRFGLASPLHVSSMVPHRALRRRGVRGTQRSSGEVTLRCGAPLLSPPDSWLAVAPDLALHDLVAVGDFLVTGVKGVGAVSSLEALEAVVLERAGAAGVLNARRALRLVRVGAWSRPESLVRVLLARAGLPEPALNVAILTPGGGTLIPDIAYPQFRVAVEYNGTHHDEPDEKVKDLRRMDEYSELHWSVVNVERRELFLSPSSVVARTIRRLRERGWSGGRPLDMTKSASLEP
jgi:hypothetical protein